MDESQEATDVYNQNKMDSTDHCIDAAMESFHMNVIFYSSLLDEKAKTVCRGLEKLNRGIGLELHRSIDSLEDRIRQPMNGIVLVLLNVANPEELADLIALKECLRDLPVILIIYDTKRDAMKKARILRPRFIFGSDDNPEEVGQIYERMLARLSTDGPDNHTAKDRGMSQTSEKIA